MKIILSSVNYHISCKICSASFTTKQIPVAHFWILLSYQLPIIFYILCVFTQYQSQFLDSMRMKILLSLWFRSNKKTLWCQLCCFLCRRKIMSSGRESVVSILKPFWKIENIVVILRYVGNHYILLKHLWISHFFNLTFFF